MNSTFHFIVKEAYMYHGKIIKTEKEVPDDECTLSFSMMSTVRKWSLGGESLHCKNLVSLVWKESLESHRNTRILIESDKSLRNLIRIFGIT